MALFSYQVHVLTYVVIIKIKQILKYNQEAQPCMLD